MKKIVIVSKARFIFFVFVLLITFSILFSNMWNLNLAKSCDNVVEYTVASGDTLWSIAEKYAKDTDIRQYIYDLKKINNMEKSALFAGQNIKIPY
ncbi:MAG: LysM peptidoglycan-binding domain-containing protein [Clostridia bacterium]|nr:LysM peptidoglycan-binding domain-containing protein [Clostridia bacterium]